LAKQLEARLTFKVHEHKPPQSEPFPLVSMMAVCELFCVP
jgi:hypothetical protein